MSWSRGKPNKTSNGMLSASEHQWMPTSQTRHSTLKRIRALINEETRSRLFSLFRVALPLPLSLAPPTFPPDLPFVRGTKVPNGHALATATPIQRQTD